MLKKHTKKILAGIVAALAVLAGAIAGFAPDHTVADQVAKTIEKAAPAAQQVIEAIPEAPERKAAPATPAELRIDAQKRIEKQELDRARRDGGSALRISEDL